MKECKILRNMLMKKNEEHGGDVEMTNVEKTMGNIDIETMINK